MSDNDHTLGDAPIEAKLREQMHELAHFLDRMFNGDLKREARKVGFVLMVFPFNDHAGRCNYISNGANRDDIVTLMKEQIKRFEGQLETKGHA